MVLLQECSHREFVDAVMLFGATLEPRGDRVVIRVDRRLPYRRALAWLIAVLGGNGIDMRLCPTSDDERIVYRSDPLAFMKPDRLRWYDQDGRQRAPDDLSVTRETLTAWSVSAMSSSRPSGARFDLPRANPLLVDRVAREASLLGLRLRVSPDGLLSFPGEEREEIARWLGVLVPRSVWDADIPVEV